MKKFFQYVIQGLVAIFICLLLWYAISMVSEKKQTTSVQQIRIEFLQNTISVQSLLAPGSTDQYHVVTELEKITDTDFKRLLIERQSDKELFIVIIAATRNFVMGDKVEPISFECPFDLVGKNNKVVTVK